MLGHHGAITQVYPSLVDVVKYIFDAVWKLDAIQQLWCTTIRTMITELIIADVVGVAGGGAMLLTMTFGRPGRTNQWWKWRYVYIASLDLKRKVAHDKNMSSLVERFSKILFSLSSHVGSQEREVSKISSLPITFAKKKPLHWDRIDWRCWGSASTA